MQQTDHLEGVAVRPVLQPPKDLHLAREAARERRAQEGVDVPYLHRVEAGGRRGRVEHAPDAGKGLARGEGDENDAHCLSAAPDAVHLANLTVPEKATELGGPHNFAPSHNKRRRGPAHDSKHLPRRCARLTSPKELSFVPPAGAHREVAEAAEAAGAAGAAGAVEAGAASAAGVVEAMAAAEAVEAVEAGAASAAMEAGAASAAAEADAASAASTAAEAGAGRRRK
jgi:hypothetical protein